MDVYDLPIYREYYENFLEIFKELDQLKQKSQTHKKLIENAYEHAIEIFPNLNAGYNYWGLKGKLQIYNKVRIILSQLQVELSTLKDLNLIKDEYSQIIISSIRYISGLIKKLEHPSKNED